VGAFPSVSSRHLRLLSCGVRVEWKIADLASRIGALPRSREVEVKRALGYALDWPELKFGNDEDAA